MTRITIKELHERTGAHVRRAAKSPIQVTDRGRLVAILTGPDSLATKRRKRSLLSEYSALLDRKSAQDVLTDLDAVRGEH
jgi:antitoxin (DNA-binding transcriptional repressor) of toxin-antitoxin stability system